MTPPPSQDGSSSGDDQEHHGPAAETTADSADIAALLSSSTSTSVGMTMATLAIAAGVSSDGAARTLVSDYLKQHPELADRLVGLTSEERRRELRAHMEALGELFGLPAPA